MDNQQQQDALNKEVVKLFKYIQAMRRELAVVKGLDSKEGGFRSVADQLNETVDAARSATENIREFAGNIASVSQYLSSSVKYQGALQYFETILQQAEAILDATQFQKEMELRVSNIVQTMNKIEGTLNSLVLIVGEGDVAPLLSPQD